MLLAAFAALIGVLAVRRLAYGLSCSRRSRVKTTIAVSI